VAAQLGLLDRHAAGQRPTLVYRTV